MPDAPASTWRSQLSLVVPRLFAMPCICLGLALQVVKRWWQFAVIWMPQFSKLDVVINNKMFKSIHYCYIFDKGSKIFIVDCKRKGENHAQALRV